jgi:hypothetical protein
MNWIQERLQKQREELDYLEKVARLSQKYNLKIVSDRWRREYLVSDIISLLTTDVEFGASCGCCSDSVVYARAYLQEDGIRVYASPLNLEIGVNNEYGSGIYPSPYDASHLSEEVQEKISGYLAENPPIDYEDEDEEDY